jgi:ATP-binding cassette, subfamily B, bacterial HlyB/CyaB
MKLSVINDFLAVTMRGLTVVLIIFFGTQLVFANSMTLGQLIAFHLLAQNVTGPILSLSTIWEKWQRLRLARMRLGDFLNEPSETASRKPALPALERPTLAARNISFGYDDTQKYCLICR